MVEQHPGIGFWKAYRQLRDKGHGWNHKRVYRIYRSLGLSLRRRVKRRLPERVRQPLAQPLAANQMWSLDFMAHSLTDGRRFRLLNIVDDYNRQALSMLVDYSLPASRVVQALEQLADWRGYPGQLRSDNGPEFISDEVARWCSQHGVEWLFIEPGKPTQNAYIERFNGSVRREVLNAYLFTNLTQVRVKLEEWQHYYNTQRPHGSLGHRSPVEFALWRANSNVNWS